MDTALRKLPPSQAWEEVERRSLAIGVAGFVFVGALQAAGAVPAIYRQTLAPVSGSVAAFLTALTLFVAFVRGGRIYALTGDGYAYALRHPVV